MTLHYADASAWGKLINDEPHTGDMLDHLDAVHHGGGHFISSYLVVTELHRAANRLRIAAAGVVDALAELSLRVPDRDIFDLAARLPGTHLRSLDALHVATAIETRADVFITYDARQAEAARDAGIDVVSPGA